ncbi:hypothetical protein BP6252_11874 [Coleophoma cylindrospora]|uniref:Heterokaryon incompatibility domain-containing protein n=1 Tax=Coleophoma cylindrospora TaxID=1849047 RepID=A0A3D8QL55_9HELO|nr:hypothetical protein BP6252_11874 [Coleophoma cylindrospora]
MEFNDYDLLNSSQGFLEAVKANADRGGDIWTVIEERRKEIEVLAYPQGLCALCKSLRLKRIVLNNGSEDIVLESFIEGQSCHSIDEQQFYAVYCELCRLFFTSAGDVMADRHFRMQKHALSPKGAQPKMQLRNRNGQAWIMYLGGEPCTGIGINTYIQSNLDYLGDEWTSTFSKFGFGEYTAIPKDPISDTCVSTITGWIDTCINGHKDCRRKPNLPMPTRLVDVLSRPEPFLVEHYPVLAPYTALSYCWGEDTSLQPFKTTSQNISSHLKMITLMDLPQTMIDAILITRSLGVQFIWIDALCLIQGSDTEDDNSDDSLCQHDQYKGDWDRESLFMKAYYGNAYVTISALDCRNSHDKMLKERKPDPVVELEACRLLFAPRRPWNQIIRQAPLTSRAWTFQERMLSNRILYYSRHEILWECCTGSRREKTANSFSSSRSVSEIIDNAQFSGELGREDTMLKIWFANADEQNVLRMWKAIVALYTQRSLTHVSDRLVALSGIAAAFQQTGNNRYIAGLWMEDTSSLLWVPQVKLTTKLNIYVAPTWSWASFPGRVLLETIGMSYSEIIDTKIIPSATEKYSSFPLGQVLPGSRITIRAIFVSLTLERLNYYSSKYTLDWPIHEPQDLGAIWIGSQISKQEAHFLLIMKANNASRPDIEDYWIRVGVGKTKDHKLMNLATDWLFHGATITDIILI